MELDDFQARWLAQDRRLEEALRINRRLWLRAELAGPRSSLRWLRTGALFNILAGALCLLWTGSFLRAHFGEPRFVVPGVALHLWLVGAVATTIAQFVKAGTVEYDAPVVEIQRQLEALRALTLRSTAMLFLFGVPIWFVPFCIVAMRSWFGVDLYAWFGAGSLLAGVAGSVALALGSTWLCRRLADRLERSPRLRQVVRGLAGHNLTAAQDQLARLAAFERGD
ncbi:MAG TPA: hypothetical protein VKY89_01370 [Thermoanaerobaculia bacterium]|nr:hypothetical protein [Thermoanaerobaculia bacterium]